MCYHHYSHQNPKHGIVWAFTKKINSIPAKNMTLGKYTQSYTRYGKLVKKNSSILEISLVALYCFFHHLEWCHLLQTSHTLLTQPSASVQPRHYCRMILVCTVWHVMRWWSWQTYIFLWKLISKLFYYVWLNYFWQSTSEIFLLLLLLLSWSLLILLIFFALRCFLILHLTQNNCVQLAALLPAWPQCLLGS